MKTDSPRFDPADDEQASLWAARLDGGEFSPDHRGELDAWLAGHPGRAALLARYCRFSAALETQVPQFVASGAVAMPAGAERPRRRWLPVFVGAALAGAAAAVAIAFWAAPSGPVRQTVAQFTAPAAQRQLLQLADGSQVEVFAQTKLSVDLGRDTRRVQLAGGEAFFTVAKDSARPFVVETPAGSVRVTGTEFNVRNTPGAEFEVIVAHGSVLVQPGGAAGATVAPVTLTAGGKLSTSAAGSVGVETLTPAALDHALAWRRGQIVFEATPLADALASFARYHGRTIAPTPDVAALRVGGRYSLDDLDGFFAALEEVLPVRVTRTAGGAIEVGARENH